ncbi:hypothetical protein [Pseudobacteriovorax antillogorgiicola]|uniref:Uncharacterized protein n=1 Tax=Pseudobacteriovorax antillogorgiicola TaxID=1513793 RepID=A0A1Y6BK73_9BACT|nr:hypothetical protein [Pseudobacteriovorax antillogorgiicola]TCS54726.1 hypothetical protein EDD56_106239 [Pseudobacteriovorax antillogorgiicola]SMF15910.1 hypothetical protein SAMN06296036_1064 [Pseudobacteriovorax antillogorgiicola]
MAKNRKSRTWSSAEIREQKLAVKSEIEEASKDVSPDERFQFILERLQNFGDSVRGNDILKAFIFGMSALNHHLKYGNLSPSEVNGLFQLAENHLKVSGLKPQASKNAYLYGELYLLMSQIHLLEGSPWESLWEQQYALLASGSSYPEGKGLFYLSLGIRALKFGNAQSAIAAFATAEKEGVSGNTLFKVRLGLARAHRLSHDMQSAQKVIESTRSLSNIPDSFLRELVWEEACCQILAGSDLQALVDLVMKKRSHFLPSYIFECFFWALSSSSTKWMQTLPKIRPLSRRKGIDIDRTNLFYRFAFEFERAYDSEVPFLVRLRKVCAILKKVKQLRNIDKEMLVWMAACRWFTRRNQKFLAHSAFFEYKSLSLRLSGGRVGDTLSLAEDLLSKSWDLDA